MSSMIFRPGKNSLICRGWVKGGTDSEPAARLFFELVTQLI
jgi:hypothetical protein